MALALLVCLPACGPAVTPVDAIIAIDGSSTVYPLTEAVAEDFQRTRPGARVIIGVAGTGGGGVPSVAGASVRGVAGFGGTGAVTSDGTVVLGVVVLGIVVVPCIVVPPHCFDGAAIDWPETIDWPEVYGA